MSEAPLTDRVDDASLDAAAEKLSQDLAAIFAPIFERTVPTDRIAALNFVEYDGGVGATVRVTLEDGTEVTIRCQYGEPIRIETFAEADEGNPDAV